jgi:hypothetical protein
MQEASVTSTSNIVLPLPLVKGERIEVRGHTKAQPLKKSLIFPLSLNKGEVTRFPNMAAACHECAACPPELLSRHH